MEKEIVKIRLQGGSDKFYKVVGDDAIILHYLLKYKLKDYKQVVFSKQALSKVKEILTYYHINYQVVQEERNIFSINNYELIKKEAYHNLDKEHRIDLIIKKIEKMSSAKLDKLLCTLEEFSYE